MERTKRATIKSVAERWKRAYSTNGVWRGMHPRNSEAVYHKILQCVSLDQVDQVIGRKSWTHNTCEECGCETRQAMMAFDVQEYVIYLCATCLNAAVLDLQKYKTNGKRADRDVDDLSVEELRDELLLIRYKMAEIFDTHTDLIPDVSFTPIEGRVVSLLAARKGTFFTSTAIHEAMYDEEPETELGMVNVMICRIRKLIKNSDFEIKNKFGVGYGLFLKDASLAPEGG